MTAANLSSSSSGVKVPLEASPGLAPRDAPVPGHGHRDEAPRAPRRPAARPPVANLHRNCCGILQTTESRKPLRAHPKALIRYT